MITPLVEELEEVKASPSWSLCMVMAIYEDVWSKGKDLFKPIITKPRGFLRMCDERECVWSIMGRGRWNLGVELTSSLFINESPCTCKTLCSLPKFSIGNANSQSHVGQLAWSMNHGLWKAWLQEGNNPTTSPSGHYPRQMEHSFWS